MATRKPWTYGKNIKDRAYLEGAQPFNDVAQEICDALERAPLRAVRFQLNPASINPELVKRNCKRGCWHIELDVSLLDKFFNGKMGIRAQYYESPQHGHFMNRILIDSIGERLVMFAVARDPTVDTSLLRLSLNAESAKVWISERNLRGQTIIGCPAPSLVEDEIRNDWLDVARGVQCGEYGPTHRSALYGVRAPLADQLEIKGAWITEPGRVEYVPEDKRDRDQQLYAFGFT
ncbi:MULTISPECIES: hypothetical protein [unclassified Caballeronia]|uniref:hypothetical protein n=1 Tax=unclassified Caballeronia TaxID=2646786 RepID=UPI002028AB29|nr:MULTISPECIES: hypothetical protein [unclassified Caballeronia]MDR5785040.1 hypothetical protein [Caballeronia sp. LP003]